MNNDADDDGDDRFADALANEHRRLKAKREANLNLAAEPEAADALPQDLNAEQQQRLEAAAPVLELIEQVKGHFAGGSRGVRDTWGGPATPDTTVADHQTASGEELPPVAQQIGRFTVIEQIGQGGFGIVLRARDSQLDRDVAIKIPRLDTMLGGDSHRRFVREATVAAALDHPGIVPVFEAGVDRGVIYLVSQLVVGENLATLLARGMRIGPRTAAEAVARLADAVEHAHQRGVLHRDLKPSNILVEKEPDGSYDENSLLAARITDFGLAAIVGAEHELTQTGAVIGTPSFMAPEQAIGAREMIGPASDIYGLGALLYQLIAGQPPFRGATLLETVRAIGNEEPVAPRSLNPDVDRDLQAICLKCLEKKPQARYLSAHELQADLRRWLDGMPVVARRITWLDRTRRWARRNKGLAAALTALAAVILAALVVSASLLVVSERNRQLAEERGEQLSLEIDQKDRALNLADRRSNELSLAFDELFTSIAMAPETRLPGAEPLRQRLLTSVNNYYENLTHERPESAAALVKYIDTVNRIANLKVWLKDGEGAAADAQEALRLARDSAAKTRELQYAELESLGLVARAHGVSGNSPDFVAASQKAIEFARSLDQSTDPVAAIETARAFSLLSDAAMSLGERTLANQWSRDAVAIWETVDPDTLSQEILLEMLSAYFTAGTALGGAENWEESRRLFEYSLGMADGLIEERGELTPDFIVRVANAHRNLGSVLKQDALRSESHFVRALELLTELQSRHPLIPDYPVQLVRLNYAWALTKFISGRYEEANEQLRTNIELAGNLLETYPVERSRLLLTRADSLALLGYSLQNLNRLEESLEALRQSRAFNEELVQLSGGSLASLLQLHGVIGGIAAVEGDLGRYDEAIVNLKESNAALRQILVADPENGQCARFLAGNLGYLRTFHGKLEQWDLARQALNESIELSPESDRGLLLGQRATVQLRCGDFESAASDLAEFAAAPAPQHPRGLIDMAQTALRLFETANDVAEPADAAGFRAAALENALARLDQMRAYPAIEQIHWDQLFAGPASETASAEIRQWREAHGK